MNKKHTILVKSNIILTPIESGGAAPFPFKTIHNIKIFKYDGTLQCRMGSEIPLSDMKEELEKAGAKVISCEKNIVPFYIPTVCGAPTGKVNVYEISVSDFGKVRKMNFDLWIFDTSSVEVFKYDGTLQCGMGSEITLETMEKELKEAGIKVLSKRKDTDGFTHIALCGASIGRINVFEIQSTDFDRALRRGFQFLFSGSNRILKKKISDELVLSKEPKDKTQKLPFPLIEFLLGYKIKISGERPGPFPLVVAW